MSATPPPKYMATAIEDPISATFSEAHSPDTTDILPITLKNRRNSLEKHLQLRPDVQELKNRSMLLNTSAAPSLQSRQKELERQQATDSLKKSLSQRPERDELVDRNILPNGTVAPSLLTHQKKLERHIRRDSLKKQLVSRPAPGKLIKDGILQVELCRN